MNWTTSFKVVLNTFLAGISNFIELEPKAKAIAVGCIALEYGIALTVGFLLGRI